MSEKQLGPVRLWSRQELAAQRSERSGAEQRDTKTIAGKFAEALGCIEDGLCWLGQVNEQYDPEQDDSRPVLGYSLHRGKPNPVIRFWIEADKASEELKDILHRLQRVEPLAPKEVMP